MSWQLSHVLWIGGSPCAGKSSISELLADRYGFQVYHCDDAYDDHLRRATPGKHPLMFQAGKSTCDEVWMHPIDFLVERKLAFYREEFEMVVEDLRSLPGSTPILVEGSALLPERVVPFLTAPNRAVWVVPREDFQRNTYAQRSWISEIICECHDPEAAWQNWMGRDAGFARIVVQRARNLGMKVIEVDGALSIEDNAQAISTYFELNTTRHPMTLDILPPDDML